MGILKKNNVITVAIPIFNGADLIINRIENIINNTQLKLDIIISDNCSTDKTYEICVKLKSKYNNIRLYRQNKNIGVIENFKFLLDNSHNEYFIFAAVDDTWEENHIDNLYNINYKNSKCALSFCNFYIKNSNSDEKIPIFITPSASHSNYIRLLIRTIDPVPHIIYGLFKKKYINSEDIKNFDFFDIFLGFIISQRGMIMISNDFTFNWNINEVRNSYSIKGTKRPGYFKFYINYLKLLKNFSLFKSLLLFILLTKWVLINSFNRIFFHKKFNIEFNRQ